MSNEEQNLTSPEQWVDNYGDALYYYALGRVRNPEVAEEVVQETFLAALKGKKSFSGRSTEKTWLLGILKHKIIDHFRARARENPVEDVENLPDPEQKAFDKTGHRITPPERWGNDPLNEVQLNEFWSTFRQCVDGVPAKLAEPFILREYEELSSQEVCSILGISANNLWVRLHRARAHIRLCLEQKMYSSSEVNS